MKERDGASAPADRALRWPFWLGAVALAAAVAKTPISGLDIWWHLRTGEALAHTPGWLAVDPFSWTTGGAAWAYKDVGADLLFYLGHRLLGDASLSLWPALAVLAIGAAFAPKDRPRRIDSAEASSPLSSRLDWRWSLLLLAAIVAASQHRLHARPMLLSHVAFAWLLVWLPRLHAASPPAPRTLASAARWRAPAAVVTLLWAWAWLHRGALIGAAALWAWTLTLVVAWGCARGCQEAEDQASRHTPWPALLASVVGTCALFATPNGTALVTTVVGALGRSDYVEVVDEWAPIASWTLLREHGSWLLLLLAALAGAIALVRRRGSTRTIGGLTPQTLSALTLTTLALGLSVIAVGASRWIPYAAIAAAHALAATWRASPTDHRLPQPASLHLRRLPVLLVLLCLVWVGTRGGLATPGTLAVSRYPTAALAFARRHKLPAQVVNSYGFGGYALWQGRPGLRTEIDGRADMVFEPALFRAILKSHSEPALFAERRRVDGATWVLGHNRPGDVRFAFLPRDRRWCLVHWSAAARIWLDRGAHAALCSEQGYRVFIGPALDVTAFEVGRSRRPALLRRAHEELARMQAASPDDLRPHIAQVVLQHALGDTAKRDRLLSELVARFGDDPAVVALLRRLAHGGQMATVNN